MAVIKLSLNPAHFNSDGLKISSKSGNALFYMPNGSIGINVSDTPTDPSANSAGNGIAGTGVANDLYRISTNVSLRADISDLIPIINPPGGE